MPFFTRLLWNCGKLQKGLFMVFFHQWLSSPHSSIKTRLVECRTNSCPMSRFSYLSFGSLQLLQSYHWPLGCFSVSVCPDCQWTALSWWDCSCAILCPFSDNGLVRELFKAWNIFHYLILLYESLFDPWLVWWTSLWCCFFNNVLSQTLRPSQNSCKYTEMKLHEGDY